MAWLNPIPAWCWLLAVLLVGGGQQMRVWWAETDGAQAKAELADYRLQVSERDRRADAKARTEEQRRQQAADEEDRNVRETLERAESHAATAESAAGGMRGEIARLRAGRAATCGAIAAQQRQAGESAIVVLGGLLEEAGRMAGDPRQRLSEVE
ncbi:hypothetical protein PCA10_25480 [Metapseudomonas resinovorans NBRC 106553]|uniref:DUF2514 family protein n=1 Tax=Metapseudomonas resinovorans NBRC 106553 TaxID=1245471 RepID=S6AIN6_METRE|nr:hypothetical protein PCA10_25480 [Pseudomonas resinovorans NBRC 106553]